jgi:hypothetical protein
LAFGLSLPPIFNPTAAALLSKKQSEVQPSASKHGELLSG